MNTEGITICDSIAQMLRRAPTRNAVKFKAKGKWIHWSWQDYHERICALGISLIELGIKPQEKVAIISSTRVEWAISDAALLGIGAIVVPIYPTSTEEEILFILQDAQIKYLILEDRSLLKKYKSIKNQLTDIQHVLLMEPARGGDENILSWTAQVENGRQNLSYHRESFEQRLRDTKPSDIATIIYTSGTTGRPKGVVITHTQIMSEVGDTFPLLGVSPDDTSLSFLPYSHILGRIESWGHWFVGFELAFAESIERMRHNLDEVQPTILIAVPRVFEKIYALARTQVESHWTIKFLFENALKIRSLYLKSIEKKQDPPIPILVGSKVSDLILKQVRGLFGPRFRFAVCGGAALNPKISQFFLSCGVLILEGYGLSETTAAVTVNRPFEYEIGTVGKPIGDVQIKLSSDGEILVRSKKIMSGYLNLPKETKEVLKDEWFYTGDIGEWTALGNLKIVDRKKDLIKTSGGKYIVPQKLSSLVKDHPLISNVYIHGELRKYVVALITLDSEATKKWAEQSGLEPTLEWSKLCQHHSLHRELKSHISMVNSKLASFETIKRFAVVPTDFSIESGEMTASLKLKSKVISQNYQELLDKLYLA